MCLAKYIDKQSIRTDRLHGATHPMQLHVEATGVAHRLALCVASPERGGAGVAVCAAEAGPARCVLLQVGKSKV